MAADADEWRSLSTESTPMLKKKGRQSITTYNVLLLFMLSIFMFMTGVQYNISQMISYHQSCQWSVPHTFLALEPTMLVAVIGSSAFITGILSDVYGRRRVMIVVVVILSTGILLCGIAQDIIQYEVGRMVTGFCLGAMFNLCIVMWMESSPIRIRKLGILVLMVMTSLGHASIVFFDYFIMVPYGWNSGVLINLLVLIPTYIILFHSDETPQYLMSEGRIPQALKTARRCGMVEEDMVDKKQHAKSRTGSVKAIFSPSYRWTTLNLIFLFGLHRLVEIGLIFGVPYIMAVNFCDEPERIAQNVTEWVEMPPDTMACLQFSFNDYLFIFSFAIFGIPGFIIGAIIQSNYLKIPDRYGILALTVIVGILLGWCSYCDTTSHWMVELKLGLVRIFIASQDQMFSVLVPSVFPTKIRNGACGFVRACGIILSSSGPFLTISLFNYISISWSLVVLAIIYLLRIPLGIALKASTSPVEETKDVSRESSIDDFDSSIADSI